MLRFTVREAGQPELPAVDLDEPRVAIGSATGARIRLPAAVARAEHVEITPDGWRALSTIEVDGATHGAGARGPVGAGVTIAIGAYRIDVAPAPAGTATPSPPQRTESLARELMRSLLGAGAAPSLVIERGPSGGAVRALPPPVAVLVIGRGDEAGWVILDEDLSRAHVEIRRGWDGVTIRDLGSKNGTRVDGARLAAGGEAGLHDGAGIELGNVLLRFRDPAERHLRGEPSAPTAAPAPARAAPAAPAPAPPSVWVAIVAIAIAVLAAAGAAWVLTS